jgi:type VI secretion system protein ImpA
MGAPATIDLEALLATIPGDQPAGASVRYAGPFDEIEEARRSDDGLEKGDWVTAEKKADWNKVRAVASETLATKSKDLQLAAWLLEVLIRQEGYAGLRDGLHLIREMSTRYWDGLHPLIEDGDTTVRAAPLDWINTKLTELVRTIPLTQGDGLSWRRWEESRQVENAGRQSAEAMAALVAEGKITAAQFDEAVAATPRAFYEPLFEDVEQARAEVQAVGEWFDAKLGKEAPSLRDLRQAIIDARDLLEGIVKKKRELEPDYDPNAAAAPDGGQTSAARRASGNLTLEPFDRADAFRRLKAVAAFFRQTEPHSPVAYLVERAIRWGEMPLEKWLQEVVKSTDVLGQVRETLGLPDDTPQG